MKCLQILNFQDDLYSFIFENIIYIERYLWIKDNVLCSIFKINYLTIQSIPCSLNGFCPVDIGELTQAKAISSRRVYITINSNNRTAWRNLKRLSYLNIHFKVSNGTPILRSYRREMGENSQSCEKDLRFSLSLHMTKLFLKGEGKREHTKEFIMHYKSTHCHDFYFSA